MNRFGRAQVIARSSARRRCLGRRAASASLLANPRRHRAPRIISWAGRGCLSNRKLRNARTLAAPIAAVRIARVAERVVYINKPIADNRAIKKAPRKTQAVHLTRIGKNHHDT
jgi:hypothetical protein